MPFKPNYRQQRSERNRVKEERKQEKLLKRQENVARRKAARELPPTDEAGDAPQQGRNDDLLPSDPANV